MLDLVSYLVKEKPLLKAANRRYTTEPDESEMSQNKRTRRLGEAPQVPLRCRPAAPTPTTTTTIEVVSQVGPARCSASKGCGTRRSSPQMIVILSCVKRLKSIRHTRSSSPLLLHPFHWRRTLMATARAPTRCVGYKLRHTDHTATEVVGLIIRKVCRLERRHEQRSCRRRCQ